MHRSNIIASTFNISIITIMNYKELLCVILWAVCLLPTHVNAQVEISASGDVSINKNLTVNKNVEIGDNLIVNKHVEITKWLSVGKDVTVSEDLSVVGNMALGTASVDDHIGINLYKTTTPSTTPYYGIKSHMKMHRSMPTSPLYGVHSIVDATNCSGMTPSYPLAGVYGQVMKLSTYPNVFAAGIAGLTHPYGGIAVYGGVSYNFTLPTSMPTGSYAGYFNGAVNVNGTLTATSISISGNLNQFERSEAITSASIENLRMLIPVTYTLKQDSAWTHDMDEEKLQGIHYGLIAQDVQKIYPELVYGNGENLSVNYIELIPLLLKSVQELSAEVEVLRKLMNQRK